MIKMAKPSKETIRQVKDVFKEVFDIELKERRKQPHPPSATPTQEKEE
jgi:hypothetical protein